MLITPGHVSLSSFASLVGHLWFRDWNLTPMARQGLFQRPFMLGASGDTTALCIHMLLLTLLTLVH